MARYYCEYCHSYLTHDTLSVRKSHLIGKNHLRITSDYYRNKYVCSLKSNQEKPKKKKKKEKVKAKSTHTDNDSKPVPFHPLRNKEKRINRKIKRIFDKELSGDNNSNKIQLNKRNNITKQDNILSQLYMGSPGYSKVFIESNRFDIGESIKQSRLPQRANQNDNNASHSNYKNAFTTTQPVYGLKGDRNEVYENGEDVNIALPPPLILSLWSNSVPKYQIYNNSNNKHISHDYSESTPSYRDNKRRYGAEDNFKYKKRRY